MVIRDALMSLWVKFLDEFLPNRIKRMIFLSSFLAYVQGTNSPDEALVRKLNQLLHLSRNDKSVMAPPLINQRIWAGIIPRDEPVGRTKVTLCMLAEVQDYKLFTSQARSVSDRILRNTPQWLRYGSNKQIRDDLVELLTNINMLRHT